MTVSVSVRIEVSGKPWQPHTEILCLKPDYLKEENSDYLIYFHTSLTKRLWEGVLKLSLHLHFVF